MPKRQRRDPFVAALGRRIRELREEKSLTVEKLAWESGVAGKGFVSETEHGRALPSLLTLSRLAERLEVELIDLVNANPRGPRSELLEVTRLLATADVQKLLQEAKRVSPKVAPRARKT